MFILDGDSQEIWMQLSEKERKEFKKIVQEQNFSNLIPEWLPWWTYKVSSHCNYIHILYKENKCSTNLVAVHYADMQDFFENFDCLYILILV